MHILLILCSFLLISYQSYSNELPPVTFDEAISKIESLQKDDLLTAIKLANFYEKNLSDFRIEERIRFKKLQAELYSDQTNYDLAKVKANEGLNLTKQLSHPSIGMAELLNIRGFAFERSGDYQAALQDYLAALEIAESLDNNKVVAQTLTNLGAIYYILEKYKFSIIVLNDALILAQNVGDGETLGLVYTELSILYSYLKLPNKALEFKDKAVIHLKKADEKHDSLWILKHISGTHHFKNKQYLKAIEFYKESVAYAKKKTSFSDLVFSYLKLSEAYLKKIPSEPKVSYEYVILAEKYINFTHEGGSKLLFMVNKADVLRRLERYKEATLIIEEADNMLSLQPVNVQLYSRLDILRIKSELFYHQGFYQKAYETQNEYHKKILELNTRNNLYALEGLRIEYESKQHEIKAKALEDKRLKQLMALKEVNKSYQERTFYILLALLTLLSLAWFYSINLKNRKKLIDNRGIDHLTDIPNRQSILLAGTAQYNQLSEHNKLSVMMIKVDNFTNINQVKGYEVGNNILIEISLIILNLIDEKALCGRYSSNEFIVFLPDCDLIKAESIANSIHNIIYRKPWDKYGLKVVSVSIGLSNNISSKVDSYESLVKAAKTLKQQAVISGGNTVCT